jgi:hypothetical protein
MTPGDLHVRNKPKLDLALRARYMHMSLQFLTREEKESISLPLENRWAHKRILSSAFPGAIGRYKI